MYFDTSYNCVCLHVQLSYKCFNIILFLFFKGNLGWNDPISDPIIDYIYIIIGLLKKKYPYVNFNHRQALLICSNTRSIILNRRNRYKLFSVCDDVSIVFV